VNDALLVRVLDRLANLAEQEPGASGKFRGVAPSCVEFQLFSFSACQFFP
jgi:hypothetical protein